MEDQVNAALMLLAGIAIIFVLVCWVTRNW